MTERSEHPRKQPEDRPVTDPVHRRIELPIDAVTLAHMVENAVFSIDRADRYEGGEAVGDVPLTHQMAALCDYAGLDFAALSRVARGLNTDEACPTCNGAAVVKVLDSDLMEEPIAVSVPTEPCPECIATGLAGADARLPSSEPEAPPEPSPLAKYAGVLATYLELTIDAVRDESSDIERVLRGAEQLLALRVDLGL
jgi:hypothetical protein